MATSVTPNQRIERAPIGPSSAERRWRVGPAAAAPYAWPFDGSVDAARLAVICIDWQVDFCGAGGYVDRMGYDIALTRAGLPATGRLLAHARATGMIVIHTREGHAPDLGDLPANKRWRSARIGAEIFLGMVRSVNLFHREDDTIDELVAQVMGVFSNGVAREPA